MNISELTDMRKKVERGMAIQDAIFYLEQNMELITSPRATNRTAITLYSSKLDNTGVTINIDLHDSLHVKVVDALYQSMGDQIQVLRQEFQKL